MKVFLSSVIGGMEPFRDAAEQGVRALGYEVIRAEDFGASPSSPQQTCLAGVRAADVVVLLLGGRYGFPQASGLSATHEEYREAKERRPVLAFVQQGVEREPEQERFIREVQDWSSGQYTENFSTPDQLRDAVIRRLHQLELARAAGTVDEAEMLRRADELIPEDTESRHPALVLAVAGGPRQQVLRPVEIEDQKLGNTLMQAALFGEDPILAHEEGTRRRMQGHALVIAQERASVLVDELGSLRITQPAMNEDDWDRAALQVIIEEDIRGRLQRALRFAGWVLDQIDPPRRLSDVVLAAALLNAGYLGWRTRAEHERSPRSGTFSRGADRAVVHLSPVHRKRAALTLSAPQLAEDLMVLLRREMRP